MARDQQPAMVKYAVSVTTMPVPRCHWVDAPPLSYITIKVSPQTYYHREDVHLG